ncbi:hypothetical protein D3C72_2184620 [compost metagenome]
MAVDLDAAAHGEPGAARQIDAGAQADGGDRAVAVDPLAIVQVGTNAVAASLQALQAAAQAQLRATGDQAGLQAGADRRRHQ